MIQKITKKLSLYNPLDYILLLYWILVSPQAFYQYKQVVDAKLIRKIIRWALSTFMWLPLLILAFAFGLVLLPIKETSHATFMFVSLVIIAWFFTGVLGGLSHKGEENHWFSQRNARFIMAFIILVLLARFNFRLIPIALIIFLPLVFLPFIGRFLKNISEFIALWITLLIAFFTSLFIILHIQLQIIQLILLISSLLFIEITVYILSQALLIGNLSSLAIKRSSLAIILASVIAFIWFIIENSLFIFFILLPIIILILYFFLKQTSFLLQSLTLVEANISTKLIFFLFIISYITFFISLL